MELLLTKLHRELGVICKNVKVIRHYSTPRLPLQEGTIYKMSRNDGNLGQPTASLFLLRIAGSVQK